MLRVETNKPVVRIQGTTATAPPTQFLAFVTRANTVNVKTASKAVRSQGNL